MYFVGYLRNVLVLMVTFMLLSGVMVMTGGSLYAQQPETNVLPAAGLPGTMFSFYATGFDGEEPVVYWFNSTDGSVYGDPARYVTYSYQGRADWTWRAPDNATPGIWVAVVQSNRDAHRQNFQQTISFEILPAEQPPADSSAEQPFPEPSADSPGAAVEPAEGPPSTRFSFYATDFKDNEKVAYWFNAPDGQVYGDAYDYVVHAYDGRADWRWDGTGRCPARSLECRCDRHEEWGQAHYRVSHCRFFDRLYPDQFAGCCGGSLPGEYQATALHSRRMAFCRVRWCTSGQPIRWVCSIASANTG